jgi:hypothetical protein
VSQVSNEQLEEIRNALEINGTKVKAWQIADELKKKYGITLDESTIRGRFIVMGKPLSGVSVGGKVRVEPVSPASTATTEEKSKRELLSTTIAIRTYEIPEELKKYIPEEKDFEDYIERDIDKLLASAYNLQGPKKTIYPLTQGKQGTGKTYGHAYYAYKQGLPFYLFSCYEDMKLQKLFGDKTIENGTVKFKESLMTQAIQHPGVMLFDEINATSNTYTYDFHALLQNRELFIKDADDGKGKIYKLHPDCKVGFAMNPKGQKYIGGNIKPANFLGRCVFITYPEFTKSQIKKAIAKRFPGLIATDVEKFAAFYFEVIELIQRNDLPIDISIRQLNSVIDLWLHGLPLKSAVEVGLSGMLDAVSQPKAKESITVLINATWKAEEID